MNRPCTSAAAVLVVLGSLGLASLDAQATSDGSTSVAAALSTYTNAEYHFTFQYPAQLKPDFSFSTQQSWTFLDPGNLNGKSMRFEIFSADNSDEGGGKSVAFLGISQDVQVGISPDVAHCYDPSDASLPTVDRVTINGVEFKALHADVGAFSAMHTREDATSYRIVHAGACFAVESVTLESHEAGSGETEEASRIAAGARAAAAEADAIIHTFRFTDLPAAGATSANPRRVTFAAGATQGAMTGAIDPGATIGYMIGASANQPLLLSVESANHDLTFSVENMKSQRPLFNTQPTPIPWQAVLPDTGDYLVQLHGGATRQAYRLVVTTPARITFLPGTVSAQRFGRTPGGLPVDFVVRVQGGQTVTLTLDARGGTAVLRAYALGGDGTSFVNAGDRQTTARFTVWHDGDVIVQVIPTDGAEVPFTLDVAIPPERG